jgi:hypothetical protein
MNMMYKYRYVYAISLAILCCVQAPMSASTAGKKLVHKNMKIVDRLIFVNPDYGKRMDKVCENAGIILKGAAEKRKKAEEIMTVSQKRDGSVTSMSPQDKAFIEKCVHAILAPVKQFLETLKSSRSTLKPLVVESLGEAKAKELFVYFEAEGSVEAAILEDITSYDKLESVINNLSKLFQDISFSLESGTKLKLNDAKTSKAKSE